VNTLKVAGKLKVLSEAHWGMEPEKGSLFFPKLDGYILVWHVMTWKGKLPWPGAVITSAHELLEKYEQFDLILTGHNHKTFVEEVDGRLLVNPGSLTRHDADQEDHKPCVFLWCTETNEVEQVFLPIEQNVISREHIEHKNEHDERISAFVERLNTSQLQGFDFKKNLEAFEKSNKVRKSVMDIVWKAVD
jgi:DNA repair exonuclease SbcCD nuclease subunit